MVKAYLRASKDLEHLSVQTKGIFFGVKRVMGVTIVLEHFINCQ
jgi:hypothetical protein